MKNFNKYFLMSTVALSGMVGMTACSSESDGPEENGNGVVGQVVKTQFALNIPYEGNTRMTSANTQADGKFLGIEKLQLLTFKGAPSKNSEATSSINIGSGDNAWHKDPWRSVYRDVAIPVGTDNFVLYGRANRKTNTNADEGYLSMPSDYETMKSLSGITFSLQQIAANADFTQNQQALAVITALNKVAKTQVSIKNTSGEGSTVVTWKDVDKSTMGSENERKILKDRYNQFISLKSGSAASVEALFDGLLSYFGEEAISENKQLVEAIIDNIEEAYSSLTTTNNTFPRNLGLPDGVANITWNSENETFQYSTKKSSIGTGNDIDYTKITYPAALAYFVSTKAMSSSKELTSVNGLPDYTEWCKGNADWTTAGFSEAAVSNNTRSVALKDALVYGVASLKLSVRCNEQSLQDNAKNQGYASDQTIQVQNSGFPVTAVLVGGQPGNVGWNFEHEGNTDFDYTIYDTKMNGDTNGNFYAKYLASTPTDYNYTLVLDNNNNSTKDKVYVTVELENNAADFYGADGLVPKGGKFYLVGLLDANGTGVEKGNLDRVFVKDYTTTANLNIKSLKSAYNCIPDLRSSKISLGLAVDLTWKSGITFDVTIQ